jgi:hypothetical protein
MNMRTEVVIEHLKKPEENHNFKNTNPMRYTVEGCCLKYPNDPGDQNIKDEDVVRPVNLKWTDQGNPKWRQDANRKSVVGLLTSGTCHLCTASGPAYNLCIFCSSGQYQTLHYGEYILDSQTVADRFGACHKTAKANRTQNWIRTIRFNLSDDNLHFMCEKKYKHIQDKDEKKREVKKDFFKFKDDYIIIYNEG